MSDETREGARVPTVEEAAKEIILVLMAEPWWRGDARFQEGFSLYLRHMLRAQRDAGQRRGGEGR